MLMANSSAILTDAFPARQRGMALGINSVAAIAGSFIGLVIGGLLGPRGTGAGLPGVRAVRRRSARSGPTVKLRDTGERRPAPHRLVGQPHVRRRPDRGAGRHHLRHPALRRPRHGLDQPVRPRRPARRRGGARGRSSSIEPRVADPMFHLSPVPDPRLHPRQHREPARLDRPRRPAVHADHLAAGHLAAAARLLLRGDAAVGRHLPAAADPRLPRRRAASSGLLSDRYGAARRSPPAACSSWR